MLKLIDAVREDAKHLDCKSMIVLILAEYDEVDTKVKVLERLLEEAKQDRSYAYARLSDAYCDEQK